MPKIFISYRRADSSCNSGRLYDWLEPEFGAENLFKDTDTLRSGEDFPEELKKQIDDSVVMLVIIGGKWLNITNSDGQRRLDAPNDYVRQEIERGLQTKGCTVIPVLVNGAKLPSRENLPRSIQQLNRNNQAELREDPDFRRDVERLIGRIKEIVPSSMKKNDFDSIQTLLERNNEIEIHQYIIRNIEKAYSLLVSEVFTEEYANIVKKPLEVDRYEEIFNLVFPQIQHLLADIVYLSASGKLEHASYVCDAINHLSKIDTKQDSSFSRFIPSLIAFYISGITAVNFRNWQFLKNIFREIRVKYSYLDGSHLTQFIGGAFMTFGETKGQKKHRLGLYIQDVIESLYTDIKFNILDLDSIFDLFEMILSMKYVKDNNEEDREWQWMPPSISNLSTRSWEYLIDYWSGAGVMKGSWKPIEVNIFIDEEEVFKLLEKYVITSRKFQFGSEYRMWRRTPNFHFAYRGIEDK